MDELGNSTVVNVSPFQVYFRFIRDFFVRTDYFEVSYLIHQPNSGALRRKGGEEKTEWRPF